MFETRTGRLLRTLDEKVAPEAKLSASPGGRNLKAHTGEMVIREWDTSRWASTRPRATRPAEELSRLWSLLVGDDAAAAFVAMGELIARPEPARAFLLDQLGLALSAEPRHLARLIEQLDHDEFQVRERATNQLADLKFAATAAVRKASRSPSLEVRLRAERLLRRLPDERNLLRVLEVLEQWEALDAEGLEKAAARVSDAFLAEYHAAQRRARAARNP